jgi:hypothetical protein
MVMSEAAASFAQTATGCNKTEAMRGWHAESAKADPEHFALTGIMPGTSPSRHGPDTPSHDGNSSIRTRFQSR